MDAFYLAVFLGYFASFLLYFTNFELGKGPFLDLGRRLLVSCLVFHGALLACQAARWTSGNPPRVWETAYGVSFAVLLISWTLERRGARYLTLFSLPVTLLFTFFTVLLTRDKAAAESGPLWFWAHVGFVLSAFACLLVSASSAFMYLVQSTQLKTKHLGASFVRLPSLSALDALHFRTLAWGVALFSLGIAAGLFGANRMDGLSAFFSDPRVLLSLVTCALYWAVLTLRLSSLRRGQKIAAGTILIFGLFVVTWMSTYAAPAGYHRGL